jgi:hypothetical protein
MAKRNRSKPHQPELALELDPPAAARKGTARKAEPQPDAPPAPAAQAVAPPAAPVDPPAPPDAPTGPEPKAVAELANTKDGCWKVLANGKRVSLTEPEWRQELARIMGREPVTPLLTPSPSPTPNFEGGEGS